MSYYENAEDEKAKQGTIQAFVWAVVVVFGMIALLLHGFAFLNWTEETNEEFYQRKYMANQIEDLYKWRENLYQWHVYKINEYENHTHRYYDGKVKQEMAE